MESNIHTIRELLAVHGFEFSKSMGQNFLVDANIPEKIVRQSGIDKSCGVLEVGPGLGALTMELSRAAGHVTAVELDKRLVPVLRDVFSGGYVQCDDSERFVQSNVTIVQGDILKLDIKGLVEETMNGLSHNVCANLPYNITTPVITALIESDAFESITVMVQREVGKRICAKPGSSEYGAFSVYVNYYTYPEILFDIPPECFMPRPKVMSCVVKMRGRSERLLCGEDEKFFFRVVRAAFGQRRKTLVNALYAVFEKSHDKGMISEIVESCGFDTRIRGEVLSIEDFVRLSTALQDRELL